MWKSEDEQRLITLEDTISTCSDALVANAMRMVYIDMLKAKISALTKELGYYKGDMSMFFGDVPVGQLKITNLGENDTVQSTSVQETIVDSANVSEEESLDDYLSVGAEGLPWWENET